MLGGRPRPLLAYDDAGGAAYVTFSDDEWHHQERLDDWRAINYAPDGAVIGVELLSPQRKGVLLDGLARAASDAIRDLPP